MVCERERVLADYDFYSIGTALRQGDMKCGFSYATLARMIVICFIDPV
jgi:hypothetical protein